MAAFDFISARAGSRNTRGGAVVTIALMVQFIALWYNPYEQMPNSADDVANARFQKILRRLPKPVFLPGQPALAYALNGETNIHQMGITDVGYMGGVKRPTAQAEEGLLERVL